MTTGAFASTHEIPEPGIPAWAAPDPSQPAVTELGARLPVAVAERAGDWARVVCSNGWTGWVDGRRLVPTPGPAPVRPPEQYAAGAAGFAAGAGAATVNPDATLARPRVPAGPGDAAGYPPTGGVGPAPGIAPVPNYPGESRPSRTGGMGVGTWIALAGAAAVVVSGWLAWFEVTALGRTVSRTAYRTPAHFLLDNHSGLGGLSLGVVVLVLGLLTVVAVFLRPRAFAVIMGVLVVAVVALFVYQVNDVVQQLQDRGASASLSDLLGVGPFVAGAGGIVAIVGRLADRRS